MKMLMSYQREELERLRVCAIEQATTIERLDDDLAAIYSGNLHAGRFRFVLSVFFPDVYFYV